MGIAASSIAAISFFRDTHGKSKTIGRLAHLLQSIATHRGVDQPFADRLLYTRNRRGDGVVACKRVASRKAHHERGSNLIGIRLSMVGACLFGASAPHGLGD